ncbi:hypothetical protein [Kitasatospora viridis]|uniref:Uncharacterized protein n=1 Tax=Kitasatospora viridis TaxID=281105 RepID=A0A561SE72_9ACTN|nr:hypothetical protein [Kitasatospora viridis]TWF73150.1 hypothetical protein FHX73_16301 [Kitasatospora viridis]
MTNETAATGRQGPGAGDWAGAAHPAGEIRLTGSAAVGRRARLLAALADSSVAGCYTIISPFPTSSVTGPG